MRAESRRFVKENVKVRKKLLKGILQNDLFYCNHLGVSELDEQDILDFTVKDLHGQGLAKYLRFSP